MSTADVPARESPNPSLPPASPGDSPGSPPAVPPVDPQPPAAGSSKKNEEIRSVAQLFFQLAGQREEQVAMRHRHREKQEWVDISWEEYARQVEQLAAALIALGIEPGDRVAILSNSRPEWAMSDLAIFAAAAVTTPIYQSNLPDEVQYILENSGSKIVFVEDREQLGKVLEVRGQLPALRHAVLYDGKVKNPGFILGYEELSEQGKLALQGDAQLVRRRTAVVDRCSQATFVYTSGTTGPPKGVVLTHENLLFEMAALEQTVSVDERDETLLFLPMAHIFARVGYLLSTKLGCTVAYAESIDRLLDNLVEIRPTFMFSVPRIYEKIYNKVVSGVQRGNRLTRQIFAFAIAIGRLVSKRRQQGRWIPPHLAVSFLVAEMLVFNKLKRRFGGKVRFFISGGAPLSREIAEFFHAAGLLVLEGYGLTETTAASHVNKLDAYRFGTVG
ncbi:MAG: AMP-binding protein, partial [Deltaproteobacteria bacterium]|nr:AMP-binding protein [Deltaproteobacteria bacterium]